MNGRLEAHAESQAVGIHERKLALAVIRLAFEDAEAKIQEGYESSGRRTRSSRELALLFLVGLKPEEVAIREFWATLAGSSGDELRRTAMLRFGMKQEAQVA